MVVDRLWLAALAVFTVASLPACGGSRGPSIFAEGGTGDGDGQSDDASDDAGGTMDDEGTDAGSDNCAYCEGELFYPCDDAGFPGDPVDCSLTGELCAPGVGCRECVPGQTTCQDNAVFSCTDAGEPGEAVGECDNEAGEICHLGSCVNACEVADDTPSNIGCEFWAADLPNSRGIDDASKEPWGVVLANAGETPASVIIERNIAAPGEAPSVFVAGEALVAPGQLEAVELPRAEVTGWTPATLEPPGPTGTAVTNNAFRIRSTGPIVVYQFNTFTNDFSNDASLLLPSAGLGTVHRVIGYPTANPIELLPVAGIPDRSSVAVIATRDDTVVKIRPGTTTQSDMQTILAAEPGDELTVFLDRWQIVNIASRGIPGDMTGTVVESNFPVAVFSTGERAIAPVGGPADLPQPPGWNAESNLCCTDHIEEQVFPASSLGSAFVVPHSPMRNNGNFIEPDILRFMAVAEPATVTTNLPPPHDSFTIEPGELYEAWAQADVIVDSTTPLMVAQILVSQTYTDATTGDPALTYFPPVNQYRNRYVFLTPPTWIRNYFVITAPTSTSGDGSGTSDFVLDGAGLPTDCVEQVAGVLANVEYRSIVCPVDEGSHLIEADGEFGLTVYGYGPAGSYAYAGGADVKPIYDVPPIP